ncbi:hypothetical protein L7F22_065875 [Adiantum nelumboides]|nr:hypothetical protein [Adiantum nelumboides]
MLLRVWHAQDAGGRSSVCDATAGMAGPRRTAAGAREFEMMWELWDRAGATQLRERSSAKEAIVLSTALLGRPQYALEMTTELEMPTSTTANHRHLDEMMIYSSLLGNAAAHGYMNASGCHTHLANDPPNNVGDILELSVPMMMHEQYKPMFECHHPGIHGMQLHNLHIMRPDHQQLIVGGGCTSDYLKDNHSTNCVDNVPSFFTTSSEYNPSTNCNNFMISTQEHDDIMKLQHETPGGFRADVIDQPLSWASIPYQDSKFHHPPPLYVNSYLLEDVIMSDNSSILSLLSNSAQSFNNNTTQHFLPLNITSLQSNVSSSSSQLNAGQLSPHIDEVGQVLRVAAPTRQTSLQALFDDDSFADGQFVSALFSDNELVGEGNEESDETLFACGSSNLDQQLPQLTATAISPLMQSHEFNIISGPVNAGTFESGKAVEISEKAPSTIEELAASRDDNVEGSIHQSAAGCVQLPLAQYSTNKRAAGEELVGPPRKRLTCATSSEECEEAAIGPVAAAGGGVDANFDENVGGAAAPAPAPAQASPSHTSAAVSTSGGQLKSATRKLTPAKKSTARTSNKQSTACDPQTVAARHRRERISERLKILQELIPNGSKVLTTDEYWPNSQKLNQPHEMNLLNLLMSKAKEESTSHTKTEKQKEKASKS